MKKFVEKGKKMITLSILAMAVMLWYSIGSQYRCNRTCLATDNCICRRISSYRNKCVYTKLW